MVYKIREACVSDARKIALLHVRSWQAAYKNILPSKELGELSLSEKVGSWNKRLNHSESNFPKTLIAECDSEIVGFCSFGSDPDDPNTGSILAIYFYQKHWGMGYSQQLIYTALNELKLAGFTFVIIWVIEDNLRALKFYKKIGFSPSEKYKTVNLLGCQIREVCLFKELL
ncbi:GNAT family N-acetyltransferase [Xenorhabdus sp. PB62.4]|uniref:GNAT family N-acetyltransferase n=1 Tax=Xenorhabdus sp. PB62.4 TaxID=1851573 RepID=UPI001656FEB8|nr:GNAT family N-acetyltransferase [Xenorhabdus sp. PB62.4]MBC8953996.1 GNAT family N-acetyltransferase [Xenorhabdus sp. PB62.4]